MEKRCVADGVYLKCSFAEAIDVNNLKVTHNNGVLLYGQKLATEADKIFLENIPEFKSCKAGGKCEFCALGEWSPLGEKAMTGENRLLLEDSTITCTKGGILSLYLTFEEALSSKSLINLGYDLNFFSLGQGMELSVVSSISLGGLSNISKNLFQNFGKSTSLLCYCDKKFKRNLQELYRETIKKGMENKKIIKIEKNGNVYYRVVKEITFKNYDYSSGGYLVFTEVDNQVKLFIVKTAVDKKGNLNLGISVPFGEFVDVENNRSILSYLKDEKEIPDKIAFTHYHMRSEDVKNSYMTDKEMREEAEYYADTNNSKKVGYKILDYLDKREIGSQEYDEIASEWSGSPYANKFYGEIEAHADLLLNKEVKAKMLRVARLNKSDSEYFNSAGIADLGNRDTDIGKKVMDFFWGNDEKNEKMLEEMMDEWYTK